MMQPSPCFIMGMGRDVIREETSHLKYPKSMGKDCNVKDSGCMHICRPSSNEADCLLNWETY